MMEIDKVKIEKIVRKIYSIALTQVLDGKLPNIKINVFKHIICGYKIPKSQWYSFMRELEATGILKYHRNHYLEVHLNSEALIVAYKLSKPDLRIDELGKQGRKK